MERTKLPRTGSDETVLRGHLTKLAVWKVLLLHGSFEFGQDEIAERLKRVGVEVAPEFVPRLYYLAMDNAAAASAAE